MSNSYSFINLLCKFDFFGVPNLFFDWKWKLNSWVIDENKKADVKIKINDNKMDLTQQNLKFEIKQGLFIYQVHQDKSYFYYSCVRNRTDEIYLQYKVDIKFKEITLLFDKTKTNGQFAFEYLGMIMPSVMLKHDILTFHGVLMEHQGKGIIISAKSGTGKTTHARLWRDIKNALIINGDRATCYKDNGVWKGYGLPWSGTSGEQINRNVPIKALVVLERGTENKASIMSLEEKLSYVLPHVLYPSWDGELVGKMMELLDEFLMDIPIIRLSCRPDAESVEVLNEVLEEIR